MWAGRRLEKFLPATHVAIRGLRNRYRQAGLGAPLVAGLAPAEDVAVRDRFIPPRLKVPVTVFLRLDDVRAGISSGELRGTLEVYTKDTATTTTVEGRAVPLEFEPSAALAYTLNDAPVWESEIRGFLYGNFLKTGWALYALSPYRPGHVPVVLIHGTASSPARWADLVNELEADPRIASRVQFWLFAYNTGNPLLYSAGLLHESLAKSVADLDPQGTDGALRRAVLIGHSQGGLLAKLMVVDSGTKFWDNVSETPFEDLRVSEETRAVLRRSLFMTPLPSVKRVIFLATPHRGSSVAGLLISQFRWLVDWALTLPPNLLRITGEVLTRSEDPLLRSRLRQGLPRSVDNMSPGNPAIQTLAELPDRPGGGGELDHRDEGRHIARGRRRRVRELPQRSPGRSRVRADRGVRPLGAGESRGHRGDPPDPAPAPRRRTREPRGDGARLRAARPPDPVIAGARARARLGAPSAPRGRRRRRLGERWPLHYSDLSPALAACGAAAAALGLLALAALGSVVAGPAARAPLLAAFARRSLALLLYWRTIAPSNDRDWAPEVARLPYATVAGDLVTLHDIRNFDYRTETDFTPAYYDRTFDLRRLAALDLVTSYWMGPAIAHVFLSFGFGDDHVAVSIEARKERGEGYSSVQGFFKRYELIYVVGDERDLIRVRTNYRRDPPEDVYLYRVRAPIENIRRLFLEYVRAINELAERPALLRHAHHELHHDDRAAHARQSGARCRSAGRSS